MKHAFLIIAHNNWRQLNNLVKLLDHKDNDIYIHIDKKSRGLNVAELIGNVHYSKIKVFSQFNVYWGGYSIVEVEMFLLETAHQIGYNYYHIISGVDLPLKSMEYIHKFFEENNDYEFISFDDDKLMNDPEIARRAKYYHLLQNYRRRFKCKALNCFFTFCERCLLGVQIILRVNRTRNLDWEIKYGSQWVSITYSLVSELVKNETKIDKIFKKTNCADELFIQTIAWNCGFKDKIYPEGNMRLIDWERGGNGNPYTYRNSDYELLVNSKMLFARKFNECVDSNIIRRLSTNVMGKTSD